MDVKNRKQKSNKFPATALAFYIKVYCKQKASSKTKYVTNLVEAIKSWLSLSELEKKEVYAKYNDCQQKYKLRFIDQLKNAEPFMKAKDTRLNYLREDTPNTIISEPDQEPENDIEEPESQVPVEQLEQSTELDLVYDEQDLNVNEHQSDQSRNSVGSYDKNENNERTSIVETLPPIFDDQHQSGGNENTVESFDRNENNERILIEEPLAPTYKTGKDLFHLLSNFAYSGDEADKITWTSLPQFEKNQYSQAVRLLKKDYLTKYKAYLESLSSRELFDYYNKAII